MAEERYEDDYEEQEERSLKRKRRNSGEPSQKGRGRSARPTIEKFQVWFDKNGSVVTADYTAPDGFTAEDLKEFIEDLQDDGFRLYRKQTFDKNKGRRDNYKKNRRYRDDYDD